MMSALFLDYTLDPPGPTVTCYSRVKAETQQLQRAVAEQQGLSPPDREVALVYRGEREALDGQQAQVRASGAVWHDYGMLS